MALFDGKAKTRPSGGNVQREKFNSGKARHEDPEPVSGKREMAANDGDKTEIMHHPDGTHTAHHPDGETSHHPNLAHLAMHMHAKHEDGPAGHIHAHESGATTHHVGHDGMVEGPHEHGSVDEAADHMKSMLGEDGENASMQETGMPVGDGDGKMDLY